MRTSTDVGDGCGRNGVRISSLIEQVSRNQSIEGVDDDDDDDFDIGAVFAEGDDDDNDDESNASNANDVHTDVLGIRTNRRTESTTACFLVQCVRACVRRRAWCSVQSVICAVNAHEICEQLEKCDGCAAIFVADGLE